MIDITTEDVISLAEACRRLPGRPSVSSLWRWRTRGIRSIRLETALCGGRRVTSLEALQRFISATTAASDGATPRPVSAPSRPDAVASAERELDELGC